MGFLRFNSAFLFYVLISCIILIIQTSHSENLSNVFVLETSDSESSPVSSSLVSQNNKYGQGGAAYTSSQANNEAQSPKVSKAGQGDDSNTRIITDEQSGSHKVSSGVQKNQYSKASDTGDESHSQASRNSNNNSNNKQSTTQTRASSSNNQQVSSKPKQTNSYANEHGAQVPKEEERLMIKITTNENEDEQAYQKPSVSAPHRNPQSSGLSQSDDAEPTHSLATHQHQKRKPSITISIQDANINKQNTGPAVILRPDENGNIVIAAVNTPSSQQQVSNNHKLPSSSSVSSHLNHQGSGSGSGSGSSSINEPYREPVNNPIQAILNHITTTTRRPIYDQYGGSSGGGTSSLSNSRPSTSIGNTNDERPHRPSVINDSLESISSGSSGSSGSGGTGSGYPIQSRPPQSSQPSSDFGESGDDHLSGHNSPTRFPLNEKNCGIMHETRIVGGEEADPDDFMWMAAIVKSRPKDGEPRPFCGGSLITRRHILTAAHCLEGLAPRDVLVRLGSYDFDDSTASSLSQDYAIDQFRVPAQYSKKTHVADIAIMRLKTPLSTSDNYKTVCMPQQRRSYVGSLGTVTGYGSQSQTFRRAAPKLRQVTVPIWENRKCSNVYKKNLTESFLCAGYEDGGKDACQGDSGGPLMTEGPEQKMMVVGVVSHGIGCGSPGYPGVYTRTTTFTDWIEKNTRE